MQVPLKAAIPFLEGALRAAAEKRRNSSIVKSLRRSENLQLREEVIKCRQRYTTHSAFVSFMERKLRLQKSYCATSDALYA